MKKLFTIILVSLSLGMVASAQSTSTATAADKKMDMKALKKEIRAERKAEHVRKHDLKHGDNLKAAIETKIISADKVAIAEHVKSLRAEGVKHPIRRSEREIRRHNIKHRH